jgi:hypothetical protein
MNTAAQTQKDLATDYLTFLAECGITARVVRFAGCDLSTRETFIRGKNLGDVGFELTLHEDSTVFVRRNGRGHVFIGFTLKAAAYLARMN